MQNEIFLSLGSNYNTKFIIQALQNIFCIFFDFKKDKAEVDNFFQKVFEKKVYYFYKAREALTFLLANILKENDFVATQGFTCYALEKAILDAKMQVVFIDTNQQDLTLDLDDLQSKYKQKKFKALILQRTFGFDTKTEAIYDFCKKNNIMIIEDLAQSFFSLSSETKELIGEQADHIILSFGRDKILDAVSGGALLSEQDFENYNSLDSISYSQVFKDSIYPLIAWVIRTTHWIYLGSIINMFFRKIGFLKSPLYTPNTKPKKIHQSSFKLINQNIKHLSQQLKHRRKIAKTYSEVLSQTFDEDSNYLRYIFFTTENKRIEIIDKLKNNGIYVSDYWYKNVVDCSNLSCKSVYDGNCKNAERLTKKIINLPTHINVSQNDAFKIANLVKEII